MKNKVHFPAEHPLTRMIKKYGVDTWHCTVTDVRRAPFIDLLMATL